MKRIRFVHVAFAALVAALAVPAAGVSKGNAVPTSVGKGEGKLTLVAWEGYTEKQWVAPFEKPTGCKVSAKYAGSSNDMFNLMTSGGGGQYDMVSASGDASLRLIYAGAVAEVNVNLIPAYKDFFKAFQSPPNNTVDGKHYGDLAPVRAERADVQHEVVREEADELERDLRPEEQGQDHDPGQPDPDRRRGALPLEDEARARDQGSVRADEGAARRGRRAAQAAAAADQEVLGASPPTRSTCSRTAARRSAPRGRTRSTRSTAAKVPVAAVIPKEGVTGLARHVDALVEGEAPELRLQVDAVHHPAEAAGPAGDLLRRDAGQQEGVQGRWTSSSKGSCAQYSANAPESYYRSIKFWKTPVADCGNGQKNCMDLRAWTTAWTQVKG